MVIVGHVRRKGRRQRENLMRFVGVREAQVRPSGLVEVAEGRVILTPRAASAILTGLAEGPGTCFGPGSQLPPNPRCAPAYRGPLVSHDTLCTQTDAEIGRSRKRRPVKKRVSKTRVKTSRQR
jgi:hypothetical protein